MQPPITDRFVFTLDVGRFFTINKKRIRQYLARIRQGATDQELDDLEQSVALRFLKSNTLGSFDPTKSHANTFLAKAINRAALNSLYISSEVHALTPVDHTDTAHDHGAPCSDIYDCVDDFVYWFTRTAKRAKKVRVGKDIVILRRLLIGDPVSTLAARRKVSRQTVYDAIERLQIAYDRYRNL